MLISDCKLSLKSEDVASIRKALQNNISHQDGIDFVMKYEFVPEAVPIHIDLAVSLEKVVFELCLK